MNTIEEQSHQLFTSLVLANRNHECLTFEEDLIGVGTGPKFTSPQGEVFYDFTGECGLLGHGHPLSLKINLLRLIHDRSPLDNATMKVESEKILSDFFHRKVFITYPQPHYPGIYAGRTHCFIDSAQKKENINILGLFAAPLGISNRPSPFHQDMREIFLTLNFLMKGQFYGENGLIKEREAQLKRHFSSVKNIIDITGLDITIRSNSLPPNFLLSKESPQKMRFPLSFNQELLNEIISVMD